VLLHYCHGLRELEKFNESHLPAVSYNAIGVLDSGKDSLSDVCGPASLFKNQELNENKEPEVVLQPTFQNSKLIFYYLLF